MDMFTVSKRQVIISNYSNEVESNVPNIDWLRKYYNTNHAYVKGGEFRMLGRLSTLWTKELDLRDANFN